MQKQALTFPCVLVVMLVIMTQVQVSGTELKVRIEKALTEKSLKRLITNLAKELNSEHSFLPLSAEMKIRTEIKNAGIEVSKYGGWYRCIAAYLLLPKIDELLAVKSMASEQKVSHIVRTLRNRALRKSLSPFGIVIRVRYTYASKRKGKTRAHVQKEQKQPVIKNFRDSLFNFKKLKNIILKSISILSYWYVIIAKSILAKYQISKGHLSKK
jgi:hypothetical protein